MVQSFEICHVLIFYHLGLVTFLFWPLFISEVNKPATFDYFTNVGAVLLPFMGL